MLNSSPSLKLRGRPINLDAREERRNQVIKAARSCFARKGFHAASTAAISAEAKISVAGLYKYFPTKNILIQDLINEELSQDLAYIKRLDSQQNLLDAMQDGLLGYLHNYSSPETATLRLAILSEGARDPKIANIIANWEAKYVEALSQKFEKAQSKKQIDPSLDPIKTARSILVLLDGVFGWASIPSLDAEALVINSFYLVRRALVTNNSIPLNISHGS